MTDPVPEVASTEKDLDTRMATARNKLKTSFMLIYDDHVKNDELHYIISSARNNDDDPHPAYKLRKEMETFKKWLEELPGGPRTENSNSIKMQECFEKMVAQNYEMWNSTYRYDRRITQKWDAVLTAVEEYRQVLTEKINTTPWYTWWTWKVTGQGRQVSVEHLLMQLKEGM
jgi:hypothetical protein